MKKLFGTTALVMALAMPAFAQTTAPADTTAPAATMDNTTAAPAGTTAMDATSPYFAGIDQGVRASDFIGKRIYVTEQDTSSMQVEALAQADAEWDDAGEISDLIISMNGDAQAVLVDFGGFLGIGEKTVALSIDDLVMVPDANSADDYFIVFHGNQAELEGAPEFDEDMVFEAAATDATVAGSDGMGTTAPMGTTATGTVPADGTVAADGTMAADGTVPADGTVAADGTMAADGTTATGAAMTDGEMVDFAAMTETDLIGARVMGPNDEDVGEVSAVAIGANGAIEGAVVDVGGFLGIGEKRVALGSDALTMVRDTDGSLDHFRVTMTQEQLESLPTYEG
ncbi:PRC-barrel domain-containing protein [Pseudotabrizicola formosa]|uniref:PRC-barrel domain-containing protein n=1 Tax=Pseudotabrizicola formosa TaxID=2030009 RepID=UPI000CD04E54|nr:PRC-barrel domain-containing protein [Pseudotabrizicola formosa]